MKKVESVLRDLLAGNISLAEAADELKGFAEMAAGVKFDTARPARTGLREVIYAPGKSPEILRDTVAALIERNEPVLVTRLDEDAGKALAADLPVEYDAAGRCLFTPPDEKDLRGKVVVVGAGAADLPAMRECLHACRFFGAGASLVGDVGVSGIHRLFAVLDGLEAADAVVVAAGMEGALPSVVNSLVRPPVIGLPVSSGYGVAEGGYAALLAMLASCSPGVTVVNIDNGVGAAAAAAKIVFARRREGEEQE